MNDFTITLAYPKDIKLKDLFKCCVHGINILIIILIFLCIFKYLQKY